MLHPVVQELFQQSLPNRPYCSDDKTARLIRTRDHAVRRLYIQHNPPAAIRWLIFDIDKCGAALSWDDAGLPPPTWSAIDPETGSGHLCYGLKTPVVRTEAGREGPLRYLAAIESAYCERLGADHHYAGLITKNPLHGHWRVWSPANDVIYDLDDLAEYVPLRKVKSLHRHESIPGTVWRNVTIFDELRGWAYRAIRDYWGPNGYQAWICAVLARAESLNDFPSQPGPLPEKELRGIAKSIAKWTWKYITPSGWARLVERTHRPEVQAMRGIKSGQIRRQATEDKRASARLMAAAGKSQRAIAAELGVSQSTVSHWLSG